MKKKITLVITIAAILMACASTAIAADGPPEIPLPSGVQIEKDNDLTSAMLSNLLGSVWNLFAGGQAADSLGGMGRYAGVVTMILQAFNLAAMAVISAAVMYMWGIFAVSTAHHGQKLGGGIYNSMWVPIRHALAFTLTVPVAKGLSLLQIGILVATSWGINLANVIWDASGEYIIEHAQSGVIDNSPPFLEEESLSLIPQMFRSAVIQQAMFVAADGDWSKMRPVPVQDLPTGTVWSSRSFRQIDSVANGRYAVAWEPLVGQVAICPMGFKRAEFADLGCVHLPAPKFASIAEARKMPTGKDLVIYQAHMGITEARVQAIVTLWDGLQVHATEYLKKHLASGLENTRPIIDADSVDALELSRRYKEAVVAASEKHVESLKAEFGVKKMLETAIDSRDGRSQIGWATAGLFSYNLAQAQQTIDTLTFGGGSTFLGSPEVTKEGSKWWLGEPATKAIVGAAPYASLHLLQGRVYNPQSEEGDGPGLVNRLITGIFVGDNASTSGILAGTLSAFREADPIVVLSNFGKKCYEIGALAAIASMVGSAGSWIPFIGGAMESVATNPFLVTGMTILFTVGVVLMFVAPFSVFALWAWAILRWFLTAIYALVAAPFWACVHALPEGDGFAGSAAKQGYVMLISLMIRPSVMVFGAIAAMAVWLASSLLYSTLLASFLNGFTVFTGKSVIAELILAVIVMIVYYYIYYQIFKYCINDGHGIVMSWIGHQAASMFGDDGSSGTHITATAGAAVGKGAHMASNAIGSAGSAAGGAGKAGKAMYSRIKAKLNDAGGKEGIVSSGGGNSGSMAPKE